MERSAALALMQTHLTLPSLRKHSLASEAVLKALARRLNQDEALWGLAGLLHDLDYEATQNRPEEHGPQTAALLKELGLPEELLAAVKAHNAEMTGHPRATLLDNALTCGEVVTGLITAAALVRPDKKISALKPGSVMKKIKDKAFARRANRDLIRLCEKCGLELPEFLSLAIGALAEIEAELAL